MTDDEKFMKEALKQAKKAYAIDEVPIGCVIVQNDKIIARGYNISIISSLVVICGGRLFQIRMPMQICLPSAKLVKKQVTGGLRTATSTSHWSHARCVPVQLYNPVCGG